MDLNDCPYCMYFESRNSASFLWIFSSTLRLCFEIRSYIPLRDYIFTGNSRINTRNVLSFDDGFSLENNLKIKDLLIAVFNTPSSYRKVEKYIDRILQFSIVGENILLRVFTIDSSDTKNLVEVGPHLLMHFEEYTPKL